jgi:hypothetical protein
MLPRTLAFTAVAALSLAPPPESPLRALVPDLARATKAAEEVQLVGTVMMEEGERPLGAAQVSIAGGGYGALTNAQGRYVILLGDAWAGREVTVRVQLAGYDEVRRTLTLSSGTNTLDFTLARQAPRLDDTITTRQVVHTW